MDWGEGGEGGEGVERGVEGGEGGKGRYRKLYLLRIHRFRPENHQRSCTDSNGEQLPLKHIKFELAYSRIQGAKRGTGSRREGTYPA